MLRVVPFLESLLNKKISSTKAFCTIKQRANKECVTALTVTHRRTLIKPINSLTDLKMNQM